MGNSPDTILVTGAGSGIGRAVALKFLEEGWRVIALGRRLELLETLSAEPGRVLPISCDLSEPSQILATAEKIKQNKEFASYLKILVNNAGVFTQAPFSETTDSDWQLNFATNLLGPVRITRALYSILKQNRGAVINISSTLGLRPTANTSCYSAIKAGLINWTQTLAIEGAPFGLRACVICPGIVDTPMQSFHNHSDEEKKSPTFANLQPLGRIGQPRDVAHAVWSLASRDAEWITGATLKVDGGIDLI